MHVSEVVEPEARWPLSGTVSTLAPRFRGHIEGSMPNLGLRCLLAVRL